jgi:hypothetical protein
VEAWLSLFSFYARVPERKRSNIFPRLPPLAAEHMPKKPNLPQSEPNPSLLSGFLVRIAKQPDTFFIGDIRE